ncbi:hypothetical protein SAMN05443637_13034 [Pseudonocardia thermophila]|jgi:hypothetical protein|uniref:Uncharacterized protein n=1 Tax=Pseudonocardia thermophila TaxID=1848 RepID=A0A1M7AVZ4_PSETH|nr:hypothetical protein [Pseudonocardia thermophila]SHL46817.1 hypothetical protein SAMN05443637_13034 [Pseudonocardia thermophila]
MAATATATISRGALAAVLDAAGLCDYELCDTYSGRGMHGATCFGVIVDREDLPRLFSAFGYATGTAQADDDLATAAKWAELADAAVTDEMGRYRVIAYFPGWQVEG